MLGSRLRLVSLIQTQAVAECLNFGHAAKALRVSQSSVSARVKISMFYAEISNSNGCFSGSATITERRSTHR
ncbi:LysR family transcriptional regulator [Camelimonas fluminis]|uniref:LysR family transcriptional regulator n=1 Tax=Camelimonas fluminis TaxID=1576911 RepID=A0ABV7UMM6_9HYPH